MDRDRWQRLQSLFYAAVEMNTADRDGFLREACGGDTVLRRQVESLVLSSGEGDSLVAQAVQEVAASAVEPGPGDRIGAYEVIRPLGHGGMGAVYLAVRADDQYRKLAAIKLIRAGLSGAEMLARFRAERQILASLDHPHIARLLDGGATPDGSPYVVMEYVDGVPIDTYVREHRLPIRDRLKLFRQVCGAVVYAHRNLVVHRDIKPANILVTEDGTPKLLDFGIAKLIGPQSTGRTVGLTRPAERRMTPEYASPEQVRGEAITTATDVYSLGVLLYELLTGQHPYRFPSMRPTDIEKVVCEQHPQRPSTAAGHAGGQPRVPVSVRRELKGDLDNIVLMALRKEPARRYVSADQFSEDVRRHLDGFPVKACKDTWQYRAGKFVRRHKFGVSAAAAFVALMLAFGAGMALLARRVAVERDTAREESAKAEQVARFLAGSFELADRSAQQGRAVSAQEMLDRGSARIRTELRGHPDVQARLMNTMGQVYRNLGLYDRAQPLLAEALATRKRVFGENSPETAESLMSMGDLQQTKGNYAAAEQNFRRALDVQRRIAGPDSPPAADAMAKLATALSGSNPSPEAEALEKRALEIRRRIFGNNSAEVADSLNRLGSIYFLGQTYAEAELALREALAIVGHVRGVESPEYAAALSPLARSLDIRGKLDEASAVERQALALHRKLYGKDHILAADDLELLGTTRFNAGDYTEAIASTEQALAICRNALGPENPRVAQLLANLGNAFERRGQLAEAEPNLRQGLAMFRKLLGEHSSDTLSTTHCLANCLREQGDFAESRRLIQGVVDWRRQHGAMNLSYAMNVANLAAIKRSQGDYEGAERDSREVVDVVRKECGEGHFKYGSSLGSLGSDRLSRGDLKGAESLFAQSIAILRKVERPNPLDLSFPLVWLGQDLLLQSRPQEAEKAAREAYQIREKIIPLRADARLALAESVLGGSLAALGRYTEAEPLLAESHLALLKLRHDYTVQPELRRLADLHRVSGKVDAPQDAAR
jgi:serine/threonine-protein kinase